MLVPFVPATGVFRAGAKQVAKGVAKETAERVAKETAERVAKEAAEKAAKEAAEKAAKEAAEKATREAAEKATREAAEKAAREQAERAIRQGAGSALPEPKVELPAVDKVVNTKMPHAIERGVERNVFPNADVAREQLTRLGNTISKNKDFPKDTILDTAHADRVLVPIGNNGLAVYQVGKNLTAKLKTILIRRG